MKFNLVYRTLKDGTPVIIREATTSDADELRQVAQIITEESEFLPYDKGEFDVSLEDEIRWIESFDSTPNSLLLIAEIDGKNVGNISLNGNNRKQLQHSAVVGIGLLENFRGKGLGSILFEEALKWAENNSELEILTLEVHKTNKTGISLYEKFGFKAIGVLEDNIKLSHTEYVDSVIMRKKIK